MLNKTLRYEHPVRNILLSTEVGASEVIAVSLMNLIRKGGTLDSFYPFTYEKQVLLINEFLDRENVINLVSNILTTMT